MQRLTDESLHTFMCEVEFIVNSTPLTKSSDDPNDLEALMPNHLLLMKSNSTLPPCVFRKSDLYSRKRWHQVQYLADLFWARWIKEFFTRFAIASQTVSTISSVTYASKISNCIYVGCQRMAVVGI